MSEHYRQHPSGVECIDIAQHHSFCIGNVLKYIWRAGLKSWESEIEDLSKAAYYLSKEISRLRGIETKGQSFSLSRKTP